MRWRGEEPNRRQAAAVEGFDPQGAAIERHLISKLGIRPRVALMRPPSGVHVLTQLTIDAQAR